MFFILCCRQICRRFYAEKCGPLYLPFHEFQRRWAKKTITTVGEAFSLLLREIPGTVCRAKASLLFFKHTLQTLKPSDILKDLINYDKL